MAMYTMLEMKHDYRLYVSTSPVWDGVTIEEFSGPEAVLEGLYRELTWTCHLTPEQATKIRAFLQSRGF